MFTPGNSSVPIKIEVELTDEEWFLVLSGVSLVQYNVKNFQETYEWVESVYQKMLGAGMVAGFQVDERML